MAEKQKYYKILHYFRSMRLFYSRLQNRQALPADLSWTHYTLLLCEDGLRQELERERFQIEQQLRDREDVDE